MTSKSFAFLSLAGLVLVACSAETISPTADPETAPPTETTPDPTTPDPSDVDAGSPDGSKADASKPDGSKPDPQCTAKRWYRDGDGDGFGAAATFMDACEAPSGYVASATDCDDTKAAIKPGAAEMCDAIDNNCDGTINGTPTETAACTAAAGSYAGTFTLYTAEKLGGSIINQMTCTGTTSLTVDLGAAVVVKGPVTCNYPGSLTAFDHSQSGTVAMTLRPDGKVEGTLTHSFALGTTRSFAIKGTAAAIGSIR
ncbi:MAG: putative metal-binding motif-containing protein [Rhizomicrobium sp.]